MHIADPRKGIFGANGIVAAGLPIAVGAATAAQLRDTGGVVVAFFGDGAVGQGMFHEAVNLAAVWQLPVIFFCENNHYAEFSAGGRPAPRDPRRPRPRLRHRLRRRRRQRRRRGGPADGRAGRTTCATAPARSCSRPRPTAGTATTRATRSATARRPSSRSGRPRDPLLVLGRANSTRTWSPHIDDEVERGDRDGRSPRRRPPPSRRRRRCYHYVGIPREPDRRTARADRRDLPHDGRRPRRARLRARQRTRTSSSPASTSARAATSSA